MMLIKKILNKTVAFCMVALIAMQASPVLVNAAPWDNGIFVSESGSDSNTGTSTAPFATIETAIDTYKSLKAGLYKNKELTIYIMGGEYELNERITLTSDHNGISIKNYNGQDVTFTGGYQVSGYGQAVTEGDLGGRLPKEYLDKIYKWDLSGLNLPSEAEITAAYSDESLRNGNTNEDKELRYQDYVPELVDNGEPKTSARWPNDGWGYIGSIVSSNDATYSYEFETTAPIENVTDFTNVRAIGPWRADYRFTTASVVGKGDGTLKIVSDPIAQTDIGIRDYRRFYIYNLPELLDSPGEYYIDYDEKVLYYYPEDINSCDLVITGVSEPNGIAAENKDNTMLRLTGVTGATIEGITFTDTSGSFIQGENCDNIIIKNCVFKNAGGRGVKFSQTTNTTVTQSYFKDIGDSSVEFLRCGDRTNLQLANDVVSNCAFENGARVVGTYAPFVSLGDYDPSREVSIGVTAENNYFHNHPHAAIMFAGNDITIQNNIFDNVVTETYDAGAVYTRNNAAYLGNVIKNNIFRNIKSYKEPDSDDRMSVAGIYLDDVVCAIDVIDNVFYECEYPVHLGGGIAHTFSNNLFYKCGRGIMYPQRGSLNTKTQKNGPDDPALYTSLFDANTGEERYKDKGWAERYPKYQGLVDVIKDYNTNKDTGEQITNWSTETAVDYSAMYVHGAVVENNISVSADALRGEEGDSAVTFGKKYFESVATFTAAQQATASKTIGVFPVNSYKSTDESQISLNGASLGFTASASAELKAYTLPDVSGAGVLIQNEIYTMPTGRDSNNEYEDDRENEYLSGHYSSIVDFEIDSDVSDMSSGETATVKFPQKVNKSFAYSVTLGSGSISLNFGGATADITGGKGLYECQVDMDNNKSYIYKMNSGAWELIEEKTVSLPDIIEGVTITAQSSTSITDMAIATLDDPGSYGYYYQDFENMQNLAPAEQEDRSISTDVTNSVRISRIEEENGNNVYHFALTNTEKGDDNDAKAFFTFSPIKLKGNRIAVEFKIKADENSVAPNNGARLLRAMSLLGYNSDNPDRSIETVASEQRVSSGTFNFVVAAKPKQDQFDSTSGGYTIGTFYDMQEDYIRIKYVLNGPTNTVAVYTYTNGEWSFESVISGFTFPEYVNRLCVAAYYMKSAAGIAYSKGYISSASDVDAYAALTDAQKADCQRYIGYKFDDIKIYNADSSFIVNEAGLPTELTKGTTVTIKPDYIPGMRTGTIFGAVYNNSKLLSVNSSSFTNSGKGVTLEIPSDANKISLFRFGSIQTLTPVAPVMNLEIK